MTIRWIVTLLIYAAAQPAAAQSVGGMQPSEFVDKWGEIKYCQEAYKHPFNRDRVYEHDTKTCEAANAWAESQVAWYTEDVRKQLNNAVEQRSRVILAGTRDIAMVLGACREACAAMASSQASISSI